MKSERVGLAASCHSGAVTAISESTARITPNVCSSQDTTRTNNDGCACPGEPMVHSLRTTDPLSRVSEAPYGDTMCRNITTLRGLEPAATPVEIEAAARQYVRKVSGVTAPSVNTSEAFELAVAQVTAATTALLAQLPPRRQPPTTMPPLRRLA